MTSALIAALIAAFASLFLGVFKIVVTLHRNKVDTITKYRMEWINDIRIEYSNILSWSFYRQTSDGKLVINPIDGLRWSTYKVSLYLNVKDEQDAQILHKTYEYLEQAEDCYKSMNFAQHIKEPMAQIAIVQSSSEHYNKSEKTKKELQKLIRLYLKVEWTRVKAESSFFKGPYAKYWNRRTGFDSKKALKDFTKLYREE